MADSWENVVDSCVHSFQRDPKAQGYAEAFMKDYEAGKINPEDTLAKISYEVTRAALALLKQDPRFLLPKPQIDREICENSDEESDAEVSMRPQMGGSGGDQMPEKIGTNDPRSQLAERDYNSRVFTNLHDHQQDMIKWIQKHYNYHPEGPKIGHPYAEFKNVVDPVGYYGGFADVFDWHFANGNFHYEKNSTLKERQTYAIPFEFFGRFGLQPMNLGHFRFMRALHVQGGMTGDKRVDKGILQLLFTDLHYFQLFASEVTKKIFTQIASAQDIQKQTMAWGEWMRANPQYWAANTTFNRMSFKSYIETVSHDVNPNFEFSDAFMQSLQKPQPIQDFYKVIPKEKQEEIALQEPFFFQLVARALKHPKFREALQVRLGLQKDFFDTIAAYLVPTCSDKPKPIVQDKNLTALSRKRENAKDKFQLREYMKFLYFPNYERIRVAKAAKLLMEKCFPLGSELQHDTDSWKLAEYQPGEDDPTRIAWLISARTDSIIVKRPERVRSKKKIFVYLDTECSSDSQTKIHSMFGNVIAMIDGLKSYCRDGNDVYLTSAFQDQYVHLEQKHTTEILAALLIPQNSHRSVSGTQGTSKNRHRDFRVLVPGRKPEIPEHFLYISASDGKAAAAGYQLRGQHQHATSFAQAGVQMAPRINPKWVDLG